MSVHKETEVRETYVYSADTFQIKVPEKLYEDWESKYMKWKNTDKMKTLRRKITNHIQKSMKKMLENPATGEEWQKDFNELFAVVTGELEGTVAEKEVNQKIEEMSEEKYICRECGGTDVHPENGCEECGWKPKESEN